MYWPRVILAGLIILFWFAFQTGATWAVYSLMAPGWKGSPESLALLAKMIGDATGNATAAMMLVLNWLYSSTIGSQRKDDTINTMAGKS